MAKLVLIIEDNPDNLLIYSMGLMHFGYEVAEALDGVTGLEKARQLKPQIILLDISLPGLDGWEVITELKSSNITASIPVIAVTAHAFADDRRRAEVLGFDGYLPKPVEPRRIISEVKRMIGPP